MGSGLAKGLICLEMMGKSGLIWSLNGIFRHKKVDLNRWRWSMARAMSSLW